MERISEIIKTGQTLPKPCKEVLPAPVTKRSLELKNAFPEVKKFHEAFNFDNCLKRYQDYNTTERALTSGKIKLNEIALTYNRQAPISLIEFWLINLASYLGLEPSDQQIREIAIYLYEDNSFFNITELTLFFKKLKKGNYGEFYGRFDGTKILTAAKEYREQRGKLLSSLPEEIQKTV